MSGSATTDSMGVDVMQHSRFPGAALAAVLTVGLLTGCSAQEPSNNEDLTTFSSSVDEAYAAVDETLECETDPIGKPIIPADGGAPTPEQRLCWENVQLDLHPSPDALVKGLELWSNSRQGEVQILRGSNWMVVDRTNAVTGERTTQGIKQVADWRRVREMLHLRQGASSAGRVSGWESRIQPRMQARLTFRHHLMP